MSKKEYLKTLKEDSKMWGMPEASLYLLREASNNSNALFSIIEKLQSQVGQLEDQMILNDGLKSRVGQLEDHILTLNAKIKELTTDQDISNRKLDHTRETLRNMNEKLDDDSGTADSDYKIIFASDMSGFN